MVFSKSVPEDCRYQASMALWRLWPLLWPVCNACPIRSCEAFNVCVEFTSKGLFILGSFRSAGDQQAGQAENNNFFTFAY